MKSSFDSILAHVGGLTLQEETSALTALPRQSPTSPPSKEKSKEGGSEKVKDPPKERIAKRNRKKEKEIAEKVVADKKKKTPEKLLSVLPLEASAVGILLLILMTSFYVVCVPSLVAFLASAFLVVF